MKTASLRRYFLPRLARFWSHITLKTDLLVQKFIRQARQRETALRKGQRVEESEIRSLHVFLFRLRFLGKFQVITSDIRVELTADVDPYSDTSFLLFQLLKARLQVLQLRFPREDQYPLIYPSPSLGANHLQLLTPAKRKDNWSSLRRTWNVQPKRSRIDWESPNRALYKMLFSEPRQYRNSCMCILPEF